jgi:formylglycine-generating enzyme required for sulfatase activity
LLSGCTVDDRLLVPSSGDAAPQGNSDNDGSAAGGRDSDDGSLAPSSGTSGGGAPGSVDADEFCEGSGCSCVELPNCGERSCCTSFEVAAGTIFLGDSPDASGTITNVAKFELDAYEVTVGRFRRYVDAYLRPPGADSGENDFVIGSGWRPEWDSEMPNNAKAFRSRLDCPEQTWTDDPEANEALPMNCVTWYEAFAFCAWEGGRLPTEVEWEYAATGGDEQRGYPWGNEPPDATLAVFGCNGALCTKEDLRAVGSKPAGTGRYGQFDLAGSVAEWIFDYYAPYPPSCDRCANAGDGTLRGARGGQVSSSPEDLHTNARAAFDPNTRDFSRGFRCAH